jgi:hypothetical protein
MEDYTAAQIKEIEADCEFWKSLIKSDDYYLIGFNYRDSASFGLKGKQAQPGYSWGAFEVTQNHLRMLGLAP